MNNEPITSVTDTLYVNHESGIPEGMMHLPNWLTKLQTEYNLSAWCFYGHVGSGKNTIGISFLLQRKNDLDYVEFGIYRPGPEGKWSFAGSLVLPLLIDPPTESAPWAAWGPVVLPGLGGVKIALISGAFGKPGAVYRLTANVCSYHPTNPNTENVFVDITIKDIVGAFKIGYGNASFLPNWLTSAQKAEVNNNTYNSSTQKYLSAENPQMLNQGSYYYSSALEVQDYTVIEWKDGDPFIQRGNNDSNNCGYLWMDNVTQTFGELEKFSNKNFKGTVSWHWFAIPRLTQTTSLAVTDLKYTKAPGFEDFKSASLYSAPASSPSSLTEHFWPMDEITVTSNPKEKTYTVKLSGSGENNINLTLTPLEGNQQLGPAIEGLFLVTGTVGTKRIEPCDYCYAWGELSNKKTQKPRIASKSDRIEEMQKAHDKSK